MASVVVNDEYLSDIADAIRAKTGTQDTYKPSQMADAISSISGGVTPSGTINITQNGTVDVTSYASANVSVQASSDWIDVTPNLANVIDRTGVAHTYDSATDSFRLYTTSNGTYRSAYIPITIEENTIYRIEFELVNTGGATANAAFHATSTDKIIFGYGAAVSQYRMYGTIVSEQANFTNGTDCDIMFYCTYSTSSAGDATWKNFRVYKHVGSNS